MARTFLLKLIKAASPSHARGGSDRSDRSERSDSGLSSASKGAPFTRGGLKSSTSSADTPPKIAIDHKGMDSKSSLGTEASSANSQPMVTVVPPSPHSSSLRIGETSDRRTRKKSGDVNRDAGDLDRTTIIPGPLLSFPPAAAAAAAPHPHPHPHPHPPPPASRPSRSHPPSPSTAPASLPLSPVPEEKSRTTSFTMAKPLDPPTQTQVRRSPSATPLTMAEASADNEVITPRPLVDSPTSIQADFPGFESTNGASSSYPSRDSDAVSLAQNGPTKEKKRPWRKSSARKPTGLAGAIAASGMAMAQPTLSSVHQASFSASMQAQAQPNAGSVATTRKSSINSPPRSPPRSLIGHVRGKSSEFTPNYTKSKRSPSARSGAGRASVSVQSDNASEYYPEDRPDYYTGLDESSDEDECLEAESMLDEMEDMPVTGFAVASNKRNADFHDLFPNIPEGDYLIEDYGCALQREILIQGRLYISENHICFHANIFGWITNLSIPMCEVTQLEKRMTAFVIPNAIQVTTRQAKYAFASFLSRDTTYDVIYNIWRLARPDDAINSSRPSLDGTSVTGSNPTPGNGEMALKPPKITTCACGKDGHYSETALDCVLPGTPDRIHNLIFASAFIKEFMTVDQKLADIQISDWQPIEPGSALLTRNMSYIKPLNASVGPKSTKCEITDLMVYKDSEHYISTDTTTRTPDVPSGGVFAVKTKTCLTWASSISTRIFVTTEVQWTGRSFIKSIIERSAIDGQKTWHNDLENAMRTYIQEHQSEFVPEGVDPAALPASPNPNVGPPTSVEEKISSREANKRREHERNQRGLQWALDTFEGASQVAIRSTKDAFELVCEAWEQSSSTTIMWFVIVALVMSNLWSLFLMGSREEAGRRKEMKKMEEREKWVQGVVTALWDELSKQQPQRDHLSMPLSKDGFSWVPGLIQSGPAGAWKKEVEDIQGILNQLEERMKLLNEGLSVIRTEGKGMDSLD